MVDTALLPGKIYVNCLENTWHEIIEPKLDNTQCGFRPGRSIKDQIFTFQQIFEKSWEYAKDVYKFFVDLEKAHDRVPCEKLWQVMRVHGVDGRLSLAVKPLYSCSQVCVRVGAVKSQPFTVGVRFTQGCVLHILHELERPAWSKHWHTGRMRTADSFCEAQERFLHAVFYTNSYMHCISHTVLASHTSLKCRSILTIRGR